MTLESPLSPVLVRGMTVRGGKLFSTLLLPAVSCPANPRSISIGGNKELSSCESQDTGIRPVMLLLPQCYKNQVMSGHPHWYQINHTVKIMSVEINTWILIPYILIHERSLRTVGRRVTITKFQIRLLDAVSRSCKSLCILYLVKFSM